MRFLSLLLMLISTASAFSQHKHRTEILLLMGSRFEITPFASSDSLVNASIDAAISEVKRIESVISEWIPESEISRVNQMAGVAPVTVSDELFQLVKRCIKVSELTDGAFDISWASARNVWRFDGTMTKLPDSTLIDSMKKLVNFRKIILNDSAHSIFLSEKGMAIGLGAIGKGYAAQRSKMVMQKMGVENGIVIAGGDLIAWGKPDGSDYWPIGIANPDHPREAIAWFGVGPLAVVTSGDYERFAMIDGKRYGHIIDPRTCYPASGLRSVTIICPDAELADALATSVFVLGKDAGMALVNQMKGVECVMICEDGTILSSSDISINRYQPGQQQQQHQITIGQ